MRRSRPAVLSVLLVVAVALAVFASSSFAVSSVTAAGDELLTDDVLPFESVRISGAVKVDDRKGETSYKLSFKATLQMRLVDARTALADEQAGWPDVVIHESIRYPTLALDDQLEFVGPVGLPFDSEELALTIGLAGACFDEDGAFEFGAKADVRCAAAKLTLGDVAFDVSDLLTKLEGRVWRTGQDRTVVKMKFDASFADPGYPFPITSLGDGSTMTVMFGPFGGTAEVRRVSFSG